MAERQGRTLTQSAFDGLLAAFDADRELAGEKYERMRSKLLTFFERRGAAAPEELADVTLTRVAHKLAEGLSVPSAELHSYVYGVARNVLRETWAAKHRAEPLDELPPSRHPSLDPRRAEDADRERRFECLGRCVEGLAAEDYEMLVAYHTGDGRARIDGRRTLAERLGVTLNTLRVKVHRVHRDLERCLERCLRPGEQ